MSPAEVTFNTVKHHLGTQRQLIHQDKNIENLLAQIKHIGNSTLDLYTGTLEPEVVKSEIASQLSNIGIHNRTDYKNHLKERGGYTEMTLSDGSRWTLRKINGKQFVHIHPSRYSPHTVRTNGSTLKTVITSQVLAYGTRPGIKKINQARKQIGLPQIKKMVKNRGIDKLIKLF